jgi:hypothetical protein
MGPLLRVKIRERMPEIIILRGMAVKKGLMQTAPRRSAPLRDAAGSDTV